MLLRLGATTRMTILELRETLKMNARHRNPDEPSFTPDRTLWNEAVAWHRRQELSSKLLLKTLSEQAKLGHGAKLIDAFLLGVPVTLSHEDMFGDWTDIEAQDQDNGSGARDDWDARSYARESDEDDDVSDRDQDGGGAVEAVELFREPPAGIDVVVPGSGSTADVGSAMFAASAADSRAIDGHIMSQLHGIMEPRLDLTPRVLYTGGAMLSFESSLPLAPQSVPEPVIQHCDHIEPATLPNDSDDVLVQEMWAQNVERRILAGEHLEDLRNDVLEPLWTEIDASEVNSSEGAWVADCVARPSSFGETIHIVGFTRGGTQLKQALHEGRELEVVRMAAEEHGQSCILAFGASIFAHPNQYKHILLVVGQHTLKPHQVITSEAFLPLVYQAVASIPFRSNVRPNFSKVMALIDGDNSETVCTVERTFINGTPHRHRDVKAVTKSTSQAHGIPNVRSRG